MMRVGARERCFGVFEIAVLMLVPLCVASQGQSVVTVLNAETFTDAVNDNPLLLVKFYAPWCGHCKQLEPEFEKAAITLLGRVTLAKVDATTETSLAERYKVDGYPTLYFFRHGVPEEYGGGRQNASIVDWVEEHAGPSLVVLKSEDALQVQLRTRRVLPYFVARGGEELRKVFEKLADEHRGMGLFFFMEKPSEAVVQVHRGFDEIIEKVGDLADPGQILQFLEAESVPPFGEINEDNYAAYLARATQGMVWLCFHPDSFKEDALRHAAVFRQVADTFKQFPVVYTDTKVYAEHVKEELGCTEFPMLVFQIGNFTNDEEDPKKYRLPLSADNIASDGVNDWMRSVLSGSVPEDDGLEELDRADDEEDEEEEGAEEGVEGADDLEEVGGEGGFADGGDEETAGATGGQEL